MSDLQILQMYICPDCKVASVPGNMECLCCGKVWKFEKKKFKFPLYPVCLLAGIFACYVAIWAVMAQ
jgi:hypothetical protein